MAESVMSRLRAMAKVRRSGVAAGQLVARTPAGTFDVWPATGEWIRRGSGRRRRGLRNLINEIRKTT